MDLARNGAALGLRLCRPGGLYFALVPPYINYNLAYVLAFLLCMAGGVSWAEWVRRAARDVHSCLPRRQSVWGLSIAGMTGGAILCWRDAALDPLLVLACAPAILLLLASAVAWWLDARAGQVACGICGPFMLASA